MTCTAVRHFFYSQSLRLRSAGSKYTLAVMPFEADASRIVRASADTSSAVPQYWRVSVSPKASM